MKYLFTLFLFSIHFNSIYCQYNLVPNSSFEDSIICPSPSNDPLPRPWYIPSSFLNGFFLHSCSADTFYGVPYHHYYNGLSYQPAKTGNGYALINTINVGSPNGRLYIQIKLKDSLIKNVRYGCSFWTNLPNHTQKANNNIAMLFTKKAIYVDTINAIGGIGLIAANPQIVNYGNPIITDTMNWVKVSGVYKAQGGEQFITIGNFKKDAQTSSKQVQNIGYPGAEYYVDDVSVIPLDSLPLLADAGADKTITIGDSAFIGSYTNGIDTIKWLQNGVAIDSIRPGFWVHPLVNTCYILTQTVNGYSSSDTVCINVNPLPLKITNYELGITNERQVLNKWVTANEINVSHFNILKSEDGVNFKAIGKMKANNRNYNEYNFTDENVNEGVNYYKIVSIDFDGKLNFSEVRKIIFHSPFSTFNLYPNPAKDYVTIECKGIKEIKVVNQLGQQIAAYTNPNNDANTINTQQFAKGVYIVLMITKKGEVKNAKFIKQ